MEIELHWLKMEPTPVNTREKNQLQNVLGITKMEKKARLPKL